MLKQMITFAAVAGLVLALAPAAHAVYFNVISVNFAPEGPERFGVADDLSDTTFDSSAVVGVEAVDNWNTVLTNLVPTGTVTVGPGTLVDDSGTTTNMSFTTSDPTGQWSDKNNPSNDTSRLLNGFIYSNSAVPGNLLVTVSNVPYGLYDVIVYFAPNHDYTMRAGISATGYTGTPDYYSAGNIRFDETLARSFLQTTGTTEGTATEHANYALFTGLTASSFLMDLSGYGEMPSEGNFYGFQVAEVLAGSGTARSIQDGLWHDENTWVWDSTIPEPPVPNSECFVHVDHGEDGDLGIVTVAVDNPGFALTLHIAEFNTLLVNDDLTVGEYITIDGGGALILADGSTLIAGTAATARMTFGGTESELNVDNLTIDNDVDMTELTLRIDGNNITIAPTGELIRV